MPQATEDTGTVAPVPYYEQGGKRARIRGFVLSEMLRGAGISGVVIVIVALSVWVVYLIGLLLPAESKNAPPPMPFSSVRTVIVADTV